jgi:predicted PhzF superfamily epimerase YddE/YHI9
MLEMDFPAQAALACALPADLLAGLGREPLEVLAAADYLAVFDSEETVRALTPDHAALSRLDRRGVIVTAPGTDVDFVSRFFAPRYGVPEDPVTGSAHCELGPYWAKRLGKDSFVARQVSKRGGELICELKGDRVLLCGSAVTVIVAILSFDA